jgi:hypothetical protein
MKTVRRIHAWLGVLFAPSIIFFALSGTLQLFGLHDTQPGETPGLVAKMGMVHTHQTATVPVRQARPPQAQPAGAAPTDAHEASHDAQAKTQAKPAKPTTMPLKLFFALMAISLIASSVLGLWIAFTSKRDRNLHIGLLALGVVLPIVLLLV